MKRTEIRKELQKMRKYYRTGWLGHPATQYGFYIIDGKIKSYVLYKGLGYPEPLQNGTYHSILKFNKELTLNEELQITYDWIEELQKIGLLK